MLPINLAHISHKEGIFVPRVTSIGIDASDTTLQYILCQCLPIIRAIAVFAIIDEYIILESAGCVVSVDSGNGRWCHYHAKAAGARVVQDGWELVLGRFEDV